MELIRFLILPILLNGVRGYGDTQQDPDVCPTWFIPQVINDTVSCICGVSLEKEVLCDPHSNRSMLQGDYCMTYEDEYNSTVADSCPYNDLTPDFEQLYKKLPRNVSELNEFMCGDLNRTGILCSHCKPGLGPAVLFSTMECLECLNSGTGWVLSTLLATFPTTVFFLVVVFCEIRLSTAPFNAFIFIAQAVVSMVNIHPYSYINTSKPANYITKFLLTAYGIFNLDFFYYIIPPFCISTKLTIIQALSLQYVVAFFPLFLVIVSYTCIQLHARGCRVLFYLWRPFQSCCICINTHWNIDPAKSLVHAFASFLLLAYSKILFVSCILLHPSIIQNSSGNSAGKMVVYYNASVPFFSTEHLPFIILAISVLATFNVFPLLIFLLYPTKIFQHCLGHCNARFQHALRTFMDAFQGYYKDGTTGTPDWRCFSGIYLIFRIVVITTHIFPGDYKDLIRFLCLATASLMFGILKPYKEKWVNVWDSVMFFLFMVAEVAAIYDHYRATIFLSYAIAVLPLVYICVYTVGKLLFRMGIVHRCSLVCEFSSDGRSTEVQNDLVSLSEEQHSPTNEDYKPLLAKSDEQGNVSTDCDTNLHSYGSM